jgi:hypothetical protein
METGFLDALLAKPPVLLGRQLREFTIGHALTFQAIAHPLVTGMPLDRLSCLTAISILELSFAECRALLASWDENLALLIKHAPDFDLNVVAPLLIEYYVKSTDLPEVMVEEYSRGPRYPLELGMIVGLMQLGKTEADALDTGFCRAVYYCAAANGRELLPDHTRRLFTDLEGIEEALRQEWREDNTGSAQFTKAQPVPQGRN